MSFYITIFLLELELVCESASYKVAWSSQS